jgi:hypothetical protein
MLDSGVSAAATFAAPSPILYRWSLPRRLRSSPPLRFRLVITDLVAGAAAFDESSLISVCRTLLFAPSLPAVSSSMIDRCRTSPSTRSGGSVRAASLAFDASVTVHFRSHRTELSGLLPAIEMDGIANAALSSVEDGRPAPSSLCPRRSLGLLFLICFRADDSEQSDVVC